MITVWPSLAATKSLTAEGGAWLSSLPPMKCEGRLNFAAYEFGCALMLPFTVGAPPTASAMVVVGRPIHSELWNFEKRAESAE